MQESFPLDKKALLQRKNNDKSKLDFMIRYLKESRICRTNMIQEYFGEVTSEVCGICDVCLSKKTKYSDTDTDMTTRLKIISLVKDSPRPISMDAIVEKIGDQPSEVVLSIIRQIVDMGDIAFNDDDKLSITKRN